MYLSISRNLSLTTDLDPFPCVINCDRILTLPNCNTQKMDTRISPFVKSGYAFSMAKERAELYVPLDPHYNYKMQTNTRSVSKAYFSDSYSGGIDTKMELTKSYVEENSKLLVVPSMYEHGPLWKIHHGFQVKPKVRKNGTVDYSWHAWLASECGDYEIPHKVRLGSSEQSYDIWMRWVLHSECVVSKH